MATNERTRVKLFPTAKATDVLFYVECTNVLPKNKNPEYDTSYRDCFPHAPEDFPNHKLVFITPADDTGKQKWYFAADREAQDDYNFAFSDADIGGVKFKSVERTYVIRRDSFSPDDPTMGTPMPDTPESMFGTGTGTPKVITDYVLAERAMGATPEKELNSLYVFEKRTFLKRTSVRQIGSDPLNGLPLSSTTTLHYATEVVTGTITAEQLFAAPTNTYWGLQSTGYKNEGKQLSSAWYLIESSQVVGGTMSGGGVLTVHNYTSNDDYYWPPVLDTYELLDWERKDGGFDYYPAIRFSPEGYRGPCATSVVMTWSVTPFTIPVVEQMQPKRVYYASPFFTLNIPECLHVKLGFECDIGSTDPVYAENTGSTRWFAATNFTTWPATIRSYDDQQPYRGGFLRTTKTVTRPTVPTEVNWTTGA